MFALRGGLVGGVGLGCVVWGVGWGGWGGVGLVFGGVGGVGCGGVGVFCGGGIANRLLRAKPLGAFPSPEAPVLKKEIKNLKAQETKAITSPEAYVAPSSGSLATKKGEYQRIRCRHTSGRSRGRRITQEQA